MGDSDWRRVAGLRVVMSWPETAYAPPPAPPVNLRARLAGLLGGVLIMTGVIAVIIAVAAQVHAPQPTLAAAGGTGPGGARGPWLRRSPPVWVDIPAIGVHARLLHLGAAADGTIRAPSLDSQASDAAWYRKSVTPGQVGTSVIDGHVDTYRGPAVFFRLGALRPGNTVRIRLADGVTAIFRVTGVREYLKAGFPARAVYGTSRHAALRLITCGGVFDYATRNYLSSVVVYASLASARPRHLAAAG